MKNTKIHAGHIELATAVLMDYRKHIIVPNVCFNWGTMECDMLIVDDKNRVTEVEIKVSIADLKADFKKPHGHKHKNLSRLIYAFPLEMLEKALPLIPNHCGIITVAISPYCLKQIETIPNWKPSYEAKWYRQCKHDKTKTPLTDKEVINLTRLGCMRIWSLKRHNNIN